jgi:hypothetical protein
MIAAPSDNKNTSPTRFMKGSSGQTNLKSRDSTAEPIAAVIALAVVARFQNIPSTKITTMPGVKNPVNS